MVNRIYFKIIVENLYNSNWIFPRTW